MHRIAPWVVLIGLCSPLLAQDSIHFVPPDRVAVRVMSEVPAIDLAPGVRVRTVVGSIGSFSFGDFDAGGVPAAEQGVRMRAMGATDVAIVEFGVPGR
jgi:hypothetical protein